MQARFKKNNDARMYRFYISDALKAIGNLDRRYYDLINTRPVTNSDPEEIKNRIKGKLKKLEEGG